MAWKCVFCKNIYFDKAEAIESCGGDIKEINNEKYWKCEECGSVWETEEKAIFCCGVGYEEKYDIENPEATFFECLSCGCQYDSEGEAAACHPPILPVDKNGEEWEKVNFHVCLKE